MSQRLETSCVLTTKIPRCGLLLAEPITWYLYSLWIWCSIFTPRYPLNKSPAFQLPGAQFLFILLFFFFFPTTGKKSVVSATVFSISICRQFALAAAHPSSPGLLDLRCQSVVAVAGNRELEWGPGSRRVLAVGSAGSRPWELGLVSAGIKEA